MDREIVLGKLDTEYLKSVYRRAVRNKWVERYVSGIEISGLENLEALRGRQFVGFSNHLSHLDYIILGKLFLKNLPVSEFPRIVAGKKILIPEFCLHSA